MSKVENSDVQFGESGEESLQSYRSINRTSVVGLSLGILSALSLLHWLLLPIVVAAILVCILALKQIAARPEEFLGRKAAVAGIALALFVLGFTATREISRRKTMDHQARQHAEHWFQLLQGGKLNDFYKAFELKKRYPERQHEGTDLAVRYGDPAQFAAIDTTSLDRELMETYMPRRSFHEFLQEPIIKQILDSGNKGAFHYEGVAGRNRKSKHDVIILEYTLQHQVDGKTKSSPLFIKLGRNFYPDLQEGHWHVVSLANRIEHL